MIWKQAYILDFRVLDNSKIVSQGLNQIELAKSNFNYY